MPETCITFGKHGARVMVEDKEVQHYAMHIDPVKKEVSCWIASEAGKKFTVVWLEHQADFPTAGYLYLDGCWISGIPRLKIHDRFHKGPTVFRDVAVSASLAAGASLAVPYLFSPLTVTDDDTYLDSFSSSSVGEITLHIYRTTAPVAMDQYQYGMLPQCPKVHERSKKAVVHQVSYGKETIVPERRMHDLKPIERLVTFNFKYRPLEMLLANEIAPRNPESRESQEIARDTPPPTSLGKREHLTPKVESDSEEESEDEEGERERALLAEARRCQAEAERCQVELERIRKARSKGNERPKKKVKVENKTFFIPGEVIDLT